MSSKKLTHNLTLSANKLRLDSLNKILKLDTSCKSKRKSESLSKQLSTVALTDLIANTSNCAVPDFKKFLNDPENIKEFREFLKAQHCEENIDFYLACEKFQNLKLDTLGKDLITFMATQIYNDFLSDNAKQQVNLDYECLERIKRQRLSKKQPPSDLFNEAQMEVYKLMRSDCYPRFCKTWRLDRNTARRILIEKLDNSRSTATTCPSCNSSISKSEAKSSLNLSKNSFHRSELPPSSSISSTMRRTRSMKRKLEADNKQLGCPNTCPYFKLGLPCGHHCFNDVVPTEECGKSDLIDQVDLGRLHQVPKSCVRKTPPPLPPKPLPDDHDLSPIKHKKHCAYVGKVFYV